MTLGPGLTGRSRTGRTPEGDDWWTLELSADRDVSWEVTAPVPGAPSQVGLAGSCEVAAEVFRCQVSGGSAVVRARWSDSTTAVART